MLSTKWKKTLKTIGALCNQENNTPCRPADIITSTAAVIEKINYQILNDEEVDPEVLRYAWNIGRLVGKHLSRRAQFDIESFVLGLETGTFERANIYARYCASCKRPESARKFWLAVRAVRPCEEFRNSCKRFVVFK